jgi:hypothetical protein
MSFSRWLLVASGMALTGPAWAQQAPPPPDRYSPAQLLNGPSLQETGRVGPMAPEPLPAATKETQPVPDDGHHGEKQVQAVADTVQAPPIERTGTIDQRRLDAEVQTRLAALDDCRIDVARRKRVGLADVQGDTLTLRWVIRPTGTVSATQVVATSATDLDLMGCVKAAMSTWSFTAPRGGPVHVERAFKFRPVQ